MSKAKTATENETETTKTEKAAPGTSVQAQAKLLIVTLASEAQGRGLEYVDTENLVDVTLDRATYDALIDLGAKIGATPIRNLAPAVQLENAQNELNDIFVRAGVVDGKFAFATPEDGARKTALVVKIDRLEKEIAKAKALADKGDAEGDPDNAETDSE